MRGCGERTAPSKYTTNAASNVKHVIGVVSGKGGVGKSLVTSLLASELRKKGFSVGILDADVTGPSIPKTFGVTDKLHADETGIYPALTDSGIKVMSVNLMLPKGDMPVAWRGPVVSGIIKQFWDETNWGDVDYMLIDMPPGTSDVFLTVFQMLPVDGIVTVSAPQELVAMIVGKAVNLAHDLDVPVVGLVENMAYFKCDECGKEHHIFGGPRVPPLPRSTASLRWLRFRSTRSSQPCVTRARSRNTTLPVRSTTSSPMWRLQSAKRPRRRSNSAREKA